MNASTSTSTTDPLDLLSRALDQTAEVIAAVPEGRTNAPTPCASWDVGTLLDHLVHDLRQFTVSATGGKPDRTAPAPHIGHGWLGEFREGAETLLDTWRKAGDLTGTITLPGLGEVPARFPVDQQTAEFATHVWDLARATGQQADLDPEVARASLDWAKGALRPEFRGDEASGMSFRPERPVAQDAPVYDRLAAFMGRDPA